MGFGYFTKQTESRLNLITNRLNYWSKQTKKSRLNRPKKQTKIHSPNDERRSLRCILHIVLFKYYNSRFYKRMPLATTVITVLVAKVGQLNKMSWISSGDQFATLFVNKILLSTNQLSEII